MDIAETIDQINGLIQELYDYRVQLRKNISRTDKKVSLLYHQIENKNYDVVSGYKMLVQLQEQLRLRRNYKNEFIKAQSATDHIRGAKLNIKKVKAKIKKVEDYADRFPGNKLRVVK